MDGDLINWACQDITWVLFLIVFRVPLLTVHMVVNMDEEISIFHVKEISKFSPFECSIVS